MAVNKKRKYQNCDYSFASKAFAKPFAEVQGDACPDLWFQSDPLRRIVAREPCNLLRRQHFAGVTGNTNYSLLSPTKANTVDITVLPKWDCVKFKSRSGFSVSHHAREKLPPWQIALFSLANVFQKVGFEPQVRAWITMNSCKRFCKRFRPEREITILIQSFLLTATVVT